MTVEEVSSLPFPIRAAVAQPPVQPQSTSTWLLFALPAELMLRVVSFFSDDDARLFRTLCRQTRDLVDLDPLSTYWRENAQVLFDGSLGSLTAIEQFEYIASRSSIARAAKLPVVVALDPSVGPRELMYYDELMHAHQIPYSCTTGDFVVWHHENTPVLVTTFSQQRWQELEHERSRCQDLLAKAKHVKGLDLTHVGVFDALPSTLTTLTIHAQSLSSSSLLHHLALKQLDLQYCPSDFDMAALPVTLEELTLGIQSTRVNLTHLVRLTSLAILENNTLLIFDAKDMPVSLRILSLSQMAVTRLVDISRLVNLEELMCNDSELQTLKGLERLTKLCLLDVRGTWVSMKDWKFIPDSISRLLLSNTDMMLCPANVKLPPRLLWLMVDFWRAGIPLPLSEWTLPRTLERLILFPRQGDPSPAWYDWVGVNGRWTAWQEIFTTHSLKSLVIDLADPEDVLGLTLLEGLESLNVGFVSLGQWQMPILPGSLHQIDLKNVCLQMLDLSTLPPLLNRLSLVDSVVIYSGSLEHLRVLASLDLSGSQMTSMRSLQSTSRPDGKPLLCLGRLVLPSALYELKLERSTLHGALHCNRGLMKLRLCDATLSTLDCLQLNEGLKLLDLIGTTIEKSQKRRRPFPLPKSLSELFIRDGHEAILTHFAVPEKAIIMVCN